MAPTSIELSPDGGRIREGLRRVAISTGRVLFGDRLGLVVFLAGLTFVTVCWRVGIFITDSYAIGNTLVNVAEGSLSIRGIVYSLTFGSQPGFFVADGTIYGRNYGHVFLSLPVLWLLDGLSTLFDPRLVLAAGWSLLVFTFSDQLGRLVDRHRLLLGVGCAGAIVAFVGNVAVAGPLDERWLPFIALQLTTMLAAAFVGVGLYRVLARLHGQRVGAVVGLLAVVATPVGFWASIPKRHVLTTLAVIVVVGTFYVARSTASSRRALVARACSYGTIALLTWLNPLEALVLFAALVPLDLVTAPSNTPRTLAVVGVVFLMALTPFLATNYAISGNPLQPPRTLDNFDGQVDPLDDRAPAGAGRPDTGDTQSGTAVGSSQTQVSDSQPTEITTDSETEASASTDGGPEDSDGSDSSSGSEPSFLGTLIGLAAVIIDRSVWAIEKAWSFFDIGLTLVQEEPERLYHTFVRSGRIPGGVVDYTVNRQEAIELTVLETAPVLGGVTGAIAIAVRRAIDGLRFETIIDGLRKPGRQTDLLAFFIAILFTLVHLERLPLHTQITVRYLLPIAPLGLYGLGRLPPVHRVLRADPRMLIGTYLGALIVGGLGFLAAHAWLGLALGEAMQLHALVGLASAILLAMWTCVEGLGYQTDIRVGVVVLLVPAALTTLFLLYTSFVYLQYGEYALPLARTLSESVPVAV